MDAVEEIKHRLNIEDVVAEYMELKRAGRNLRGLSPFSNEKSPSFMVSPEKQIWHDFSSGKGGNMFSFVMEMEGVDFKGALDILARKAGVDLSQFGRTSGGNSKQKQRLYDALEAATRFYQVQFSKNQEVLTYVLKKRGYTKQTALTFRIGYSPNNGRALADHLKKRGYTDKELGQAGLVSTRYRTPNDMFRGRLMVPLMDSQGRVVGFTARTMDPNDTGPKYINTPATMLYDKSRHVFGLNLAKESIRKQKFVVAVEGNLDVIASHQAGVVNVVATAGTAMTAQHLKELKRFTNDIRLSFDQDNAGLNAAERAIPLANTADVSLSIITVPEGKDPDELIKKDPKLWEAAIEQHQPALEWLIDRYKQLVDVNSAPGKRKLTDTILPLVRVLNDSVEQDHYLERLSQELGVSRAALAMKLHEQKTANRTYKKRAQPQQVDARTADTAKSQNQLLALLLVQPTLREHVGIMRPEMFNSDDAQTLLLLLNKYPSQKADEIIAAGLKEDDDDDQRVQSLRDYGKVLILLYEELYPDLEFLELRDEAARLQVRVIEQYVKAQKAVLSRQMTDADEAQTDELLQSVKQLDVLLKQAKETLRGERQGQA